MATARELSDASRTGGFFTWLSRRTELKHERRMYTLQHPASPIWNWPDARGWIGLGVFVLVITVLVILVTVPDLRQDEYFKTIATLIIGAFIKDVVAWAYAATKGGGELAERNAGIVEQQATAATANNDTTGGRR